MEGDGCLRTLIVILSWAAGSRRNLNQTKAARLLGMSQTGYSKYETRENDIPSRVLIKLARFYNASVDYLLGLTDQTRAYPRPR